MAEPDADPTIGEHNLSDDATVTIGYAGVTGPHVTLTALEAEAEGLRVERAGWEGEAVRCANALAEAKTKLAAYDGAQQVVDRMIAKAKAGEAEAA